MTRTRTLPPVTQQHLLHAYIIIRPIGVSFAAAMQRPERDPLRRVIEHKAALLRTTAWKAALRRVHTRAPTPTNTHH